MAATRGRWSRHRAVTDHDAVEHDEVLAGLILARLARPNVTVAVEPTRRANGPVRPIRRPARAEPMAMAAAMGRKASPVSTAS